MKQRSYLSILALIGGLSVTLFLACGKDTNRASGAEDINSISGSFSPDVTVDANPIVPGNPTPPNVVPTPAPLSCDGSLVEVTLIDEKRLGLWQGSSTQQVEVSAKVNAQSAGIYEFYTAPWGVGTDNVDGDQINESFYTKITNNLNQTGWPIPDASKGSPNCGEKFVVVDNDNNGATPAPLTYMGKFALVKGNNNTLTVYHFCDFFLQSQGTLCANLHQGDPQAQFSCLVCGGNNLEVIPQGVCVRKVPVTVD